MRPMILVLATAVLTGCALSNPPTQVTPVIATLQDTQTVAGVWRGSVESTDDRFAGTVEFRFEAGGAVIVPSHPSPSRILWVRITGDHISGALEPYFDKWRASEVYSTFEATLTDGVMHGTLRERVHMRWNDAAKWTAQHVAN